MNNFFYDNSDFDLFKKALRSTQDEPVIINVNSNDSSLDENKSSVVNSVKTNERKNMSSKFQASPFDKFFGPRKKRTDPLDMKDFSSWKNKNYRESEKQINEAPEENVKFSFSDYLNSKMKTQKYNEEDQFKADTQKPIEEMSSNDENYERFSLDSYLNKLEQQTKAKKDFNETEDLIDGFDNNDLEITTSPEQDESFNYNSDMDVEKIAFDENLRGDSFAFEKEELEKVKSRIQKIEMRSNNIKEKATTKVISGDELSDLTGSEDDDFNFDKLGIEDDIESINKRLSEDGEYSENSDIPEIEHKKFIQINRNEGYVEKSEDETDDNLDDEEFAEDVEEGVVEPEKIDGAVADDEDIEESGEVDKNSNIVDAIEMPEEQTEQQSSNGNENKTVSVYVGDGFGNVDGQNIMVGEGEQNVAEENVQQPIQQSTIVHAEDSLSKTDFKKITDEFLNKFSQMYRGPKTQQQIDDVQMTDMVDENGNPIYQQQPYIEPDYQQTQTLIRQQADAQQFYQQSAEQQQYLQLQQNELQTRIIDLIEHNKKSDDDIAEKLQLAELEKQRVTEEYENKLRELEMSIKQKDEEAKQQAFIEKLKSDIRFKKAESDYRIREELIKENEKLNSEIQFAGEKLKGELNNYLSVSNLEMDKKLLECVTELTKEANVQEKEVENKEKTEVIVKEVVVPAKKKTTTAKKSTRRRKIDSDIIGGIDFD